MKLGLILLFLLSVKFCNNTNYILPFHTKQIYYNESLIKQDYLSKIYSSKIYTNFIIGSNKEEIKAIINMSQVGFFIYDNAYDYNSSSSFNQEFKSKYFYKRNYEEGYISNDSLCLIPYKEKQDINNLPINNCNNFGNVKFSLLKSKQKDIDINIYENYGIIGLQQCDSQDEYIMPLFIKSLKNTDMINSHTFSFNFINNTKSGENEGYILLGDEEFDEDKGFLRRTPSQPIHGQIFWKLVFSTVIIGCSDTLENNNLKNLDIKYAEIIGDLPYIIGVKEYKNYINSYFFQDLVSKDVCTFKNILIDEDYSTYVCNSKSELFIEKYNNSFPKLYFQHYDLNKTFILEKYDLFCYNNINKSDPNIYFLVIFPNKNEPYRSPEFPGGTVIPRWKFGIPFLKKYKLIFNSDNHVISYYEKFNNDNNRINDNDNKQNLNDNKLKWIYIIIIAFLLVIFFVLGILFHKNIYQHLS